MYSKCRNTGEVNLWFCPGNNTIDKQLKIPAGIIIFIKTANTFKQIAANPLGEVCNSTPAVAGGQIFIRTHEALYCIGEG